MVFISNLLRSTVKNRQYQHFINDHTEDIDMSTNNAQDEKDKKGFSFPLTDILFGLLDRLFKDANGKVLASRVATLIVLFVMAVIWVKGDQIMQAYKESKFESYTEVIQKERDKKFDKVVAEQLQIAHVSSGSDFSSVYSFRPRNLSYFVDLVAFEGMLPSTVDSKNLGGFPIDKTSSEYTAHLAGIEFVSTSEFIFLPTKVKEVDLKYMYSCPYFNIDNVYAGAVALHWYGEPKFSEQRLNAICNQAARAIGRAR